MLPNYYFHALLIKQECAPAQLSVENRPESGESAARHVRPHPFGFLTLSRSAAHKGLQLVRHPNARLHDLWREHGAVDRVEHIANERP